MNRSSDIAPYHKEGRLADVIAAIQVMGSTKRPEGTIESLANELDRKDDAATIQRWTGVFEEHREFFVTYRLTEADPLKAALRWRYAFKSFDSETGKEYKPDEIKALPAAQRSLLTSKPLGGAEIQTLLNTAIGLHARAMEEQRDRRWWVPLLAAVLAFAGAIAGTVLTALLGVHK